VVPAYSLGELGYYAMGLKAYDLLAIGSGVGGSRSVGRTEALRLAPSLAPFRLHGGIVYTDGQFDDARFAIGLVRTLLNLGGVALNGLSVSALKKEQGRVSGVEAIDGETGERFAIRARAVVNATGVESDTERRLDDPSAALSMSPSRGSHVVLDRSFLPGETAVMIPKTDDGRVLFAIPWKGSVLLGTTDTPVETASREPRPSSEEVGYLLDHASRYFSRNSTASGDGGDRTNSLAFTRARGVRGRIGPDHDLGGQVDDVSKNGNGCREQGRGSGWTRCFDLEDGVTPDSWLDRSRSGRTAGDLRLRRD
jgi:glycerol-3-phosphate dehydrogenase